MKIDVKKNTKLGIVYSSIDRIISLLLPFIIRKVTINIIGIDFLGVKSLFNSILSVLNLTELGISSAIVFSMYKPIAEDDEGKIEDLVVLFKAIYRIVGLVILIIGISLIPFLPKIINGYESLPYNIEAIYLVILSNTVFSYWFGAYKKSILNAYQRIDVLSALSSIITILLNVIELFVLIYVKNIYVYLSVATVITIINNISMTIIVKKLYPKLSNIKKKANFALLNDIKKNVVGLFFGKICDVARTSLGNIFISMYLGVSMIAIFNNYFLIITSLNTMTAAITLSLSAGIGNRVQTQSLEDNYHEMRKLNYIYMIIANWCSICLLCLYQPFIRLVYGSEYLLDMSSIVLLVILFYVQKAGDIQCVYTEANGLYWENKWRYLLEVIVSVVLNVLLINKYSVNGLVISLIVSLVVASTIPSPIILFKYYFRKGIKEYFITLIKYALLTVASCSLVYCVSLIVNISPLIDLIVIGLICIVVSPIVLYILYRRDPMFEQSKEWVIDILKNSKG